MPVKDSLETTQQALTHLFASHNRDWVLTVYNDFSTPENTLLLKQLSGQMGFRLVNWEERTDHPSPNYRLTLIEAQQAALEDGADLLIVESDVMIRPDTIERLQAAIQDNIGMAAAITCDEQGKVNFPYLYAKDEPKRCCKTNKRVSFCCTLLTHQLLQTIPFESLSTGKDWFDVTISHLAIRHKLTNLLLTDVPVLHKPHSSRPWKKLKATNPLRYYWNKIIHGIDRI